MKKMIIGTLVFTLLTSANVFAKTSTTHINDLSKLDDITQTIQERADFITEYLNVTSIQYAVSIDGDVVISSNSGVYSKTQDTDLTNESMYAIGSISKMYVTTAIMQLVEDGKINLDTPLYEYIENFTMIDERYKDITVRMLLNHSSGLYGSTFINAFTVEDTSTLSKELFLEQLSTQTLKANPGEFSVYCNDGFTLAEILVEQITQLSFTEYIHQNITIPLNLHNTKTPIDEFNIDNLAKVYNTVSGEEMPRDTVEHIGTGGIYSTAEDLVKFGQIFAMENDIISENSRENISNKEYTNGFWTKETNSVMTYGLGFDNVDLYPFNQYGIDAYSKSGDTLLSHSNLTILDKENIVIAVVSSGGSSVINQMLSNSIASDFLDTELEYTIMFDQEEVDIMPIEVLENSGLYISGFGMYDIKIYDDSTLEFYNIFTENKSNFTYSKDGYFISDDKLSRLSFEKLDNGNTYIYLTQLTNILPINLSNATGSFLAQKVKPNELSDNLTKNTWENRDGDIYFGISDGHMNQLYSSTIPIARFVYDDLLNGYLLNAVIVDENSAINYTNIPIINGRDSMDYKFYQENDIEFLDVNGRLYINSSSIDTMPISNYFEITISDVAKYLKIPEDLHNKTIDVTLPENSAYAIYDEFGMIINFTSVTGNTSSIINNGGYILFVGDEGATFEVSLSH